jgi:predicted transposase/invertase (TIGR01784 family)
MQNITPRVDIAFKKIFGVEENKDILILLINSIVSAEDQVSEITLLNPYNPKNFKNDKLSILDIKAKGENGKRFNIEIQISDEADYDKRALYYWAKLYTEQLKEAEDYGKLSKAIGIHILNFYSIPASDKYHNVFHITEKENGINYFKDLELHTIELKKFTDNLSNTLPDVVDKIKTSLDIWAAFLTKYNLFDKDNLPEQLKNTGLVKALNVLDVMNFSEEEREGYEDHLKWLRIQTNTIKKYAQEARNEGLAEGVAKGLAEGVAKGLAEGVAKGREEVANSLLLKGADLTLIAEVTELPLSKIEELKSILGSLVNLP